jgi:death-on-curing protein
VQFLTVDEVVDLHQEAIERFGGAVGVRDVGGLESAVAAPEYLAHYEPDADLPLLAATLMERIIRNHPFVDGNKRSGTAAMLVFLELNGVEIPDGPDLAELEELAVRVACRDAGATDVARLARRWLP